METGGNWQRHLSLLGEDDLQTGSESSQSSSQSSIFSSSQSSLPSGSPVAVTADAELLDTAFINSNQDFSPQLSRLRPFADDDSQTESQSSQFPSQPPIADSDNENSGMNLEEDEYSTPSLDATVNSDSNSNDKLMQSIHSRHGDDSPPGTLAKPGLSTHPTCSSSSSLPTGTPSDTGCLSSLAPKQPLSYHLHESLHSQQEQLQRPRLPLHLKSHRRSVSYRTGNPSRRHQDKVTAPPGTLAKPGPSTHPTCGSSSSLPTGTPIGTDTRAQPSPDLRILSSELARVSDWHTLGLKLGLRADQLSVIQINNQAFGVERCKSEMLDKWLRTNPSASWRNVVSALQSMEEHAVANRVMQKYIQVEAAVAGPAVTSDDFTKRNLSIIQRKFGKLLLLVRTKFQDPEFDKDGFLLFLVSVLPAGAINCLAQSSDLENIFKAITVNKLWTFLDYHLLEQIIELFWESDQELSDLMEQYKKDLSGYKTATKLKDHIAAALQLDAKTSTSTSDSDSLPITGTNYDQSYFRKLSVKLDEPFSEYTLDYLCKLWKSLQDLLRLPPLALLLDTIHEGCICITWLIPKHLASQATERALESAEFFERYRILSIIINDELLYDVKPIVPKEKTFRVPAKEMELQEAGQRESRKYILDAAKSDLSSVADVSTSQQKNAVQVSLTHREESSSNQKDEEPPKKKMKAMELQDNFKLVMEGQLNISNLCLSCGCTRKTVLTQHPLFDGGLCKTCKNKFIKRHALEDSDGTQMYCTICCDGGELFVCSKCEKPTRVYCSPCIQKLCGSAEVERVRERDPWQCYLCLPNPSPVGLLIRRKDWKKKLQELCPEKYRSRLPPKSAVKRYSQLESGMQEKKQLSKSRPRIRASGLILSVANITPEELKKMKIHRELKGLHIDMAEPGTILSRPQLPTSDSSSLPVPSAQSGAAHPLDDLNSVVEGQIKISECIGCGDTEISAEHPLFYGGLCDTCKDGFQKRFKSLDKDGTQKYCIICSGGGKFICDGRHCTKVYCSLCIENLCGPGEVERVRTTIPWLCYMCSPTHNHVGNLVVRKHWKKKLHEFLNAKKRRQRCGICVPCRRPDCGKCDNCRDKTKFGGPNTKKQACIHRTCVTFGASEQPVQDTNSIDSPSSSCEVHEECLIVSVAGHTLDGEFVVTMKSTEVDERRKEEESHLLATVDKIMRKKGELEQTIVQGVFIGPAGSGKSSLMRRLLNEGLPERSSTAVAENALQVKISKPSSSAAVIGSSPSKAKIFPWSRLSYDDEVVRLLKTLKYQSLINPQSSDKPSIPINQDPKAVPKSQTLTQPEAVATLPTQESQESIPQEANLDKTEADNAMVFSPETPAITLPNVPNFKTHQEVFKDALRMGWAEAQKHLQGACIMYLTDTGGQLEFQELLSALLSGPSVFFLVFRLDWDLNTCFDIEYVDPDRGTSKPYKSSIILKDALLQSLASIASMGRFVYKREGVELEPLQPKVFFVGTHKDKVKKETIEKIDTELNIAVKSTAFYREGLVQLVPSSDNPNSMQMLLTVNNLSEDDSDFERVRKAVENVINQDEFKVRAPPQWLILSLVLRQEVAQPVISYKQCRSLAKECGINDEEELDKALLFLSTRVGLIRYFPKNEFKDLSEIVIRDPRILFDKISELVIETFIFPKVTNPYTCEQFVKKGFFLQSDFEKISQKTEDDLLTAKRLVNLLTYLHIIAPVHKEGEEAKFFMPCILHHAEASCPVSEMTKDYAIPPLLVCFHCGYCPKGLFPALIAYLLNNRMESKYRWILQDNEIYKNKVFFSIYPLPYIISMKVVPSYIEICISNECNNESPHFQYEVCKDVITSIQMGIDQVISDLHYIVNTGHYLAFYCNCTCKHCKPEFHGAEFDCDYSGDQSPCLLCHCCWKPVNPPTGYCFWFPKEDLNQKGITSGTPKLSISFDGAHEKLTHKRDEIVRYLAACVSPGRLADKFLAAGLINDEIRDNAFVAGVTNPEKIRPMIDLIIVKTELNAAKYYKKFINVLKEIGALEDITEITQIPVEQ